MLTGLTAPRTGTSRFALVKLFLCLQACVLCDRSLFLCKAAAYLVGSTFCIVQFKFEDEHFVENSRNALQQLFSLKSQRFVKMILISTNVQKRFKL
jgi:hypothetical protein